MQRVLAICCICALISGCASQKTITNLPPGVSNQQVNNWISATNDLNTAYSITHLVKTEIINARNGGVWTDNDSYGKALEAVGKALQTEIVAADALKKQPNDWSQSTVTNIGALIGDALTAIQSLNALGVTGIKNSQTLKTVNGLITQAIGILQAILALKPIVTGASLQQYELPWLDRGRMILCYA